MGERSRLSRSCRWLCAHLACGAALAAFPAIPRAQTLPPAIRACAAESDAHRRHACYDREVARSLESERRTSSRREPASASSQASGASSSSSRASPAPEPSTARSSPRQERSAGESRDMGHQHGRLSARVLSIDSFPGELVLHLDNGEVWEQLERTSGDLSLRAGDTVTIERHLGSYWLSARHISAMRVRRRS